MKKAGLIILTVFIVYQVNAQIGVGTNKPAGSLEVTSGDSAKYGMVIPIVNRVSDVVNPAGGGIKQGTIVFELFNNTLCFYRDSSWVAIDPAGNFRPGTFHSGTTSTTYIKASNTGASDVFGNAMAISPDGNTLVVGAYFEDDYATGVTNPNGSNSATNSGAVYVYIRNGNSWDFQQYIKASNAYTGDGFGYSLAISSDGNTLAVGAIGEDDNVTGVTNPDGSNSANASGAAYIYVRSGSTWSFQQYIKASNTQSNDQFGYSMAISHDGNTLAVAAPYESDSSAGVTTPDGNNASSTSGAVYVYSRSGTTWSFQQYIKAINPGANDFFGRTLDLSADGNTLVAGAAVESDTVAGVCSPDGANKAYAAGAAYVYTRSGSTWSFQQYLKAINPQSGDYFGFGLALSDDGNTLAVSAPQEDDGVTGVCNPDGLNGVAGSGAVYIYVRSGTSWSFQQYIKASNTGAGDQFGYCVSLNGDGNVLCVSAIYEDDAVTGVTEPDGQNSAGNSGAVYVYRRSGNSWSFDQYVKASNTGSTDVFGYSLNISSDSSTMAVGAKEEDDNVSGVTTPDGLNAATNSGACYIIE